MRIDVLGVLIDRLGKDIDITPADGNHFRTTVTVVLSQQFYGWIMALGGGVKIISPEYKLKNTR